MSKIKFYTIIQMKSRMKSMSKSKITKILWKINKSIQLISINSLRTKAIKKKINLRINKMTMNMISNSILSQMRMMTIINNKLNKD